MRQRTGDVRQGAGDERQGSEEVRQETSDKTGDIRQSEYIRQTGDMKETGGLIQETLDRRRETGKVRKET